MFLKLVAAKLCQLLFNCSYWAKLKKGGIVFPFIIAEFDHSFISS